MLWLLYFLDCNGLPFLWCHLHPSLNMVFMPVGNEKKNLTQSWLDRPCDIAYGGKDGPVMYIPVVTKE